MFQNYHPANKSIRKISKIMEKIEHRAVNKLLTKQGKSVQTILLEMEVVCGDHCPGKTMVYKRNRLLKQH